MRRPSLYVRDLRFDEARKLKGIRDRSKQGWRRRRAGILLASHTEMSAAKIAELYQMDESQVRKVIREFNEKGFESLRPRTGAGVPGGFTTRSESGSSTSRCPAPVISGSPSTGGRSGS